MDIQEIIAAVTEGLPAEDAARVRAAIERDSVKAKAAGWKQQSEFDSINTQLTAAKAELDGGPEKPGAKAYRDWYEKHYAAIAAHDKAIKDFDKKYGDGSFLKAAAGEQITGLPAAGAGTAMTPEEMQRLVDKRFQEQIAPNVASVLKNTGRLVQRHMLAGRKTEIDFDKIDELMGKGMSLDAAYAEYDKPEREKTEKADRETEIKRRVDEEMQKRGASTNFPSGADMTPGALAARTKDETSKFDKVALGRDLASTWMTSGTENKSN